MLILRSHFWKEQISQTLLTPHGHSVAFSFTVCLARKDSFDVLPFKQQPILEGEEVLRMTTEQATLQSVDSHTSQ